MDMDCECVLSLVYMQVLCRVVEALKSLHAAGYAHRDLKPSNILRRPGCGEWCFIDFGCAARIGAAPLPQCLCYSLHECTLMHKLELSGFMAESSSSDWMPTCIGDGS
jgi:serine/threonine protein kinase